MTLSESLQAAVRTGPTSDPFLKHLHFFRHATMAFVALLLTSGYEESANRPAFKFVSTDEGGIDEQTWHCEIEAATDECLKACELGDMISVTAACACLKKCEQSNLHAIAKNTSPKMHAALQNLADLLLARPHLAKSGCAMLRAKIDKTPNSDYRRLLTRMLPPNNDRIFDEPWNVMAGAQAFLDDEERAKLLMAGTKERIEKRRNKTSGQLLSKK